MHWLLLLAVLSSTTSTKNGGSTSTMNRLAENALRKQIGTVRSVRVAMTPGKGGARGNFDSFDVNLDGFAADKLMALADRTENSSRPNANNNRNTDTNNRFPTDDGSIDRYPLGRKDLQIGDLGDLGTIGDILKGGSGNIGDILGGVLGGKSGLGRVGRIRLHASNFTFGGANYDALDASLGEVRFNWSKALLGDMEIQSVSPGTLGLSLRADQAARLLAPRLPSVRDVRVRFANGLAYVGGKTDFYGARVPFEVGAKLSVQANQVRADNFKVSVSKLKLPSFVVQELTRGLNPLYDFDPQGRFPLAINLQTAATNSDALAMRGGISWRGFGNASSNTNNRNGSNSNNRDDSNRGSSTDSGDRYPDDATSQDNTNRQPADILGDIFGR